MGLPLELFKITFDDDLKLVLILKYNVSMPQWFWEKT